MPTTTFQRGGSLVVGRVVKRFPHPHFTRMVLVGLIIGLEYFDVFKPSTSDACTGMSAEGRNGLMG
jgi:hypothetical protein